MTKHLSWLVAAVLAGASACGDAGRMCTVMGCFPGISAKIASPSGPLAEGSYTIRLDGDGDIATCSFDIPADLPEPTEYFRIECDFTHFGADAGGFDIDGWGSLKSDCDHEGQESCASTVIELEIGAVPRNLSVEVKRNEQVLLSRQLTPAYQPFYPNGKECDGNYNCPRASLDLNLDE